LRWWEAIAPYNGDVRGSLRCPEATEPRGGAHPGTGSADSAWQVVTYETVKPQRIIRGVWTGSYGLNLWIYRSREGSVRPKGLRTSTHEPERVPLLGDCCELYSDDTDSPVPKNLQDPGSHGASGIAEFCIDRHQMAVNVVFLDGHAEHVPLSNLWTLKWSETFQPRDAVVPRVR
jgi:prepilin-type processing-associated H-X9-DG protein